MNILETIVAKKQAEVTLAKQQTSINDLRQMPFFRRNTISLKSILQKGNTSGIIAEFKRKSPSKGIINVTADVVTVTSAYAKYAAGISVLTDASFFGGSFKDLQQARIQPVPILRKDFMIDAYQIYEAKAIGADVILLIAACLTPQQVKELATVAKQLGLEVLLEIHGADELQHICNEVDLVGVNNRNLKTFEVNIQTSLHLIAKIPDDKIAITESGISSIESIQQLKLVGFKGFLMGENFMKHASPEIAFTQFVHQLNSELCG
ncbi:MAG: indole-3-glycerol phosphate synthase TrpC [Hydrotalea flava]|nr:indole-3-glycerol phosphate synthase TrpC [Hydrotalea flava]NIM38972.1 indole-3-glycerol phosphate synthase TrpC [Hydrotalea flava]NIN04161.1 indole-3-glycerol phosphate synthase TrpC [Hydrotalea flava]NIN15834.1 indole-3-glycerol phosphate synthase TrpC [Hydrotalea flava]NIO94898.1 indole-3-glycerol phosphate synthase TrpC [Hydrotalea flava]